MAGSGQDLLAPLRAAEAAGLDAFTPLWSGQAAALGRDLPTGDLVRYLSAIWVGAQMRSDGVPHEPQAWLMVTARPMLRWAARTLSPCDGAIARLSPLSCGLRGR